MNGHLSQNTLIKYLFNLNEESKADIAKHLDQCPQCAARRDQLKAKFATLDTLNEEIKADEALIAKTIAAAKAPTKPTRNRFIPPTWLSAVAAILLIGTLAITIFQFNGPDNIETADLTKKDQPIAKTQSDHKSPELKVPGTFNFDNPPFAPASAIELNVLPKKESTQITIYNSADLTLVREKRKLTLKRGWNWLQFMWANTLIDPTSLSLEPTEQRDKVRIEQLVFPARLKDIGRWLIASETEGQVEFEITYFISGVNWRAFYMGTLTPDEKQMKLEGYVKVANNSGEDFEKTQTRLIVGKVNLLDRIADLARRQHPYNSPLREYGKMRGWDADESDKFDHEEGEKLPTEDFGTILGGLSDVLELKRKEVKKQGLSEYFLYTIEGTENIKNKWAKRLPSFTADQIDVESLYKYDENLYGKNVIRFVSFKNDEDHNLGNTPIPNGSMKIYADTGENGSLSFTGSTNIKYIPVNEKVELNLGNARGVIVQPKIMDQRTRNYTYDKNGNIAGYEKLTTYKLDVRNTRRLDIRVEIKRHFPTKTWQLESYQKYEKIDADTIKYNLNMKPESKMVIKYVITTYHGKNETIYNEKQLKARSSQKAVTPQAQG